MWKSKVKERKQVGKFLLGPEIGKGYFGSVYQGLNIENGSIVAIKQIRFPDRSSSTLIENVKKEIDLLRKCKHENIIQYFGSIPMEEDKSEFMFVLEYMESGSLLDILEQFGLFPETLIPIYIYQILNGLNYLHSLNIIHKDVKAANVLLTKEGIVKLADFGIAIQLTGHESESYQEGVQGSPYWMAPEVIAMEGKPTTKSDIWSLGSTVLELLTGYPPWGEETAVDASYKIVKEDVLTLIPSTISPELQDFLQKCFEKDFAKRPSGQELIDHKLFQNTSPQNKKIPVSEIRKTVALYNKTLISSENDSLITKDSSQVLSSIGSFNFYDERSNALNTTGSFRFLDESSSSPSSPRITNVLEGGAKHLTEKELNEMDFTGLSVKIGKAKTKKSGPKVWTEYEINISLSNSSWTIWKRYRDFFSLHTKIKKVSNPSSLPPFPPKKRFNKLETSFVEQRKEKLNSYIQQLSQNPSILKLKEFKIFFV